jgi:hypothetical protein
MPVYKIMASKEKILQHNAIYWFGFQKINWTKDYSLIVSKRNNIQNRNQDGHCVSIFTHDAILLSFIT